MRNLREISGFSITRSPADAVEDLGNLPGLEEIDVGLHGGESDKFRKHEEMLISSLCKLGSRKLQSLRILGSRLEFLQSWSPLPVSLQVFYMLSNDYYFTKVPEWIAPALTSLSFLDINLAELTEEGLHTLGELPSLLCLKLCWKTNPKERLTVQGTGFPTLKKLVLFDWAYVTFMKGAMPKLEKLELKFDVSVAKGYGFNLGIEHLTCLEKARLVLFEIEDSESKAAAAAITKEIGVHPNHPILSVNGLSPYQRVPTGPARGAGGIGIGTAYEEAANDEEKNKEHGNTQIQGS